MEIIVFDDNHIQVNEYLPKSVDEHDLFWQGLKNDYLGYSIDFCYHNNDVPMVFMEMVHAHLLEECVETRLFPVNFLPENSEEILLITGNNFDLFASLHDAANPDIYWTSEKIYPNLNNWFINVYDRSYIIMNLKMKLQKFLRLKL